MSRKFSKKLKEAIKLIDADKVYELKKAIELTKKTSITKFDSSIEFAFNLNLDVRKADQQLRGAILLPNGTGKTVKVLVATDNPEQAKASTDAKADVVMGSADLTTMLKTGKFDFDVIVADPKMMPVLGRFGKELGPKGLMPNPKTGTVTPNVAKAVEELKKGKANYRTDKNGNVHVLIGKSSFTAPHLLENANVILDLIKKLKPAAVKGAYIKNLTLSSTMGPSIKVKFD